MKQNSGSIENYMGLKTAIVNGETQTVKEMLADQSMTEMEKGYLIDLAKLSNNQEIIAILKDIPQTSN
ncbi:hypothetical protein [Alteromonas sp. C1M14]|uniref:hypothetical protein n=1 Tax=Alteromonas sp. C1M14 TaxID=2841567 RepID=UPI001C09860A|nr:hypothetical protein [Alteromonas sp. C1M14]MBU2978576.1 hypothetical protein [Alteromonas sp. C1M14]